MNGKEHVRSVDKLLLLLGLASLIFYPITAVPGVIIGIRRKAELSKLGRIGYALCWICGLVFAIHLLVFTALWLQVSLR